MIIECLCDFDKCNDENAKYTGGAHQVWSLSRCYFYLILKTCSGIRLHPRLAKELDNVSFVPVALIADPSTTTGNAQLAPRKCSNFRTNEINRNKNTSFLSKVDSGSLNSTLYSSVSWSLEVKTKKDDNITQSYFHITPRRIGEK